MVEYNVNFRVYGNLTVKADSKEEAVKILSSLDREIIKQAIDFSDVEEEGVVEVLEKYYGYAVNG